MEKFSEETTPLERALSKGNKSQLECFLKSGVDPNYKDRKDNSMLYNAVKSKQYDIVSLLLNFKANPNFINNNGEMAIHLATKNGDIQMCDLLLSSGANLLSKNVRNQTPISIALKDDLDDLLLFFFKKNPEVFKAKESNGKSLIENSSNPKLKKIVLVQEIWERRKVFFWSFKHDQMISKLPEGLLKNLVSYL